MAEGQQQETQRVSTQTNTNYDYIQYRLNNQNVVTKFEDTLSGIRREYIFDKDAQDYKEVITQINKPLINDEGRSMIVGYFSMLANSSTVQGNLTREELNNELLHNAIDINQMLSRNGKLWHCVDTRKIIHSVMMNHLSIFLTRPKDNLERESYVGVKQQESTVIKDNSKRFGFV
jgi:hypothetical protein